VSTVHTAGVNWESVAVIVSAIATTMAFILTLFARVIGGSIAGAVDKLRIEVIAKMDNRITTLEIMARLYHPEHKKPDS
jgi:hypothetical protein